MKGRDCETIRDLLPELDAGSIAPEERGMVQAHLGSCPDCQKDLEVIDALRGARPEVPPELENRIQAKVREEMIKERTGISGEPSPEKVRVTPIFGRLRLAPTWFLSAAAVVMLALGTGVIWNQRASDSVQDPVVVASQEPLPEAWLWDDGLVAGAPVFDGLSDEDLEALLKEFEG